MGSYKEAFPVGTVVTVRDRDELDAFAESWKYHNPIASSQLSQAGTSARVAKIGFYHGGDVLYELEGIPGVWHECCLRVPTNAVA